MSKSDSPIRFRIGVACRMAYTNYAGETAERHFLPLEVYHGTTHWHPEPGWMLRAYDYERQAERDFSLDGFCGPGVEAPSTPRDVGTKGDLADRMIEAERYAHSPEPDASALAAIVDATARGRVHMIAEVDETA